MTTLLLRSLSAMALAAMVSACGGGGGSGKSTSWAEDACKTFPAEAASKAAGVTVTKAETPGQTGNEQTLVSNCNYSSEDGKTNFGILLRQDKSDPQSVDELIAGMRTQPDMTGPSEDVTMPKGKAVWAPKLRTLSYIPEAGRMIVVTPPGAITFGADGPPPGDLKAKAIAIATAIEG